MLRARPNLLRRTAWTLLFGLGVLGCTGDDPSVAQDFELTRFAGSWYEIARIPRDHDRLCQDTRASYRLTAAGELELLHQCHLGSPKGALSEFRASASVDDPKVPAKLSLEFGLYRGAYWVLEVGPDYEYAVIGHPSRTMLWVLAREPSLPQPTYARLLDNAQSQGFGVDALELTPQSAAEPR